MSGQNAGGDIQGTVVVGYVRVSTDRQGTEGGSLEHQKEAIRALAEKLGIPLYEIFEDRASGLGADSFAERPGLQNALRAVKANDGILVVWDWSRLSRHADAHRDITAAIPDERRILSINDNGTISDAVEAGRFAHNQSQGERQSRRTKAGMQKRREQGATFGNPKIEEAQRRGADAVAAKAAARTQEMARFLSDLPGQENLSRRKIADLLNATGSVTGRGLPWDASRIRLPLEAARDLLRQEEAERMRSIPGFGLF